MTRKYRLFGTALATAVLGSALLAIPTASASSGGCKADYDVCLYFNSDFKGAKYGKGETGTYNGLVFGGGAGSGQPVKNNAASVANLNTSKTVTIYYNSKMDKCRFACQHIPPMKKQNLNGKLKNENAAQQMYYVSNKPNL